MSAVTACNLALDGCGVVILLLFLLPQFSYIYGKGVNRHKRRLLNDAAVIHLFGLLIRFGGSISRQVEHRFPRRSPSPPSPLCLELSPCSSPFSA